MMRYTEYVMAYTTPAGYTARCFFLVDDDTNHLQAMLTESERCERLYRWTGISLRKAR